MPEEIASYKSVTGLSNFLRQSVYAMPKPDSYVPNFM
jgi:hypothetical protein